MFGQVACTQSEETEVSKSLWGLTVAFLGVIICSIIRFTSVYMRNMDILNEKLSSFDVNTVGKYTVMGTVSEEVWIKFNVLHA